MSKARMIFGVVLSALAILVVQSMSKSAVLISKISGKEKVMFAGGSKGGDSPGRSRG